MNNKYKICLLGNPKTGKSSIFKKLIKQKKFNQKVIKKISTKSGSFNYLNNTFEIIDIPSTFSLYGLFNNDMVARDYICFRKVDAVLIVCDATQIVKNLNLLFQTAEYNPNIILVVNFIDKAEKHSININRIGLMYQLGVPVVFTSAKKNMGFEKLKETIQEVCEGKYKYHHLKISYPLIDQERIKIVEKLKPTQNYNLLSMRILDSNDDFFKSLPINYSKDEVEKIQNIRRNYNNHDQIREYILKRNYEISNEICSMNIYYAND